MSDKQDRTQSYLGNMNLKRSGVEVEYTQEEMQEYIKCAQDPLYFFENYIKIVNVDKGLILFEPYNFQKEIIDLSVKERFVICKLPRQSGKALTLDTPILTPNGLSSMGDLKVGDKIYGKDGKEANVSFITETMYNHKVYEVVFDNGDIIKADAEHLWEVNSTNWTAGKRVLTTEEIIQYVNHTNKPFIELNDAIEGEYKNLTMDPYLLGLWLGDGDTKGARITSHKDDFEFYRSQLNIDKWFHDKRNLNVIYFKTEGGQSLLKEMNLYGNKHIPDEYLTASKEQRIALIQGLMDSDGSLKPNTSSCEFYNKNEGLCDQLRTLLSSMGIKSRKRYKSIDGVYYFTVSFSYDGSFPIFRLERKNSLLKKGTHKKSKRYFIHEIREIDSEPVRCLQVDNNDHLFLAGTTLIPTHNTTTIAAVLLWYVLFTESFSIAILANKMQQSREILSRIQLAYEHLPKWLQQGVIEWNKGNIELENGSKILASATSSSAVRGGSFNLIYMDELAFVSPNIQEEFFASVYPTISSGKTSKILITSTPNGLDMFYRIWSDSEQGKNSYKRVEVNWWDVPGRDENFKKETIANTSEEQWRVEFECEFLGSQFTLIDPKFLRQMYPEKPVTFNDRTAIYEEPEPNKIYVMTCDVARGVNLDYSAISVIDVTQVPYKMVARFKANNVTVQEFPKVIYELGMKYNEAFCMVEINDVGQQVADILERDLEYENMVSTSFKGRDGVKISSGFGGVHMVNGLRTTLKTKKIGCSNLKTLIENKKLIANDFEVISELSTFISTGQTFAADKGKNDDIVMTLVMFGWMTTQDYFKNLTDTDYVQNLLQERKEEMDSMLPFGFINAGDGYEDDGLVL